MQTFMRIFSLLPVVPSLLWVVKSSIEAKKNEKQRGFPWYEKDIFWVSAVLSVTLIFAVVLWIFSYKIV